MSLLGSLLKRTNLETGPESPGPNLGLNKFLTAAPAVPALEKLPIGSKRKNFVDNIEMEYSNSSSDAVDCAGKMTKLVPDPGQAAYMGPNLWDEVLTFGECSTLEFLNAEDFLFETGITLEKETKKSGPSTPAVDIPSQSSVKVERPIKTAVYRLPNTASSSAATSPSTSVASVVSTDSSVLRSMLATEKKEIHQTLDTDILQKLLQGCSIPQNRPMEELEEFEEEDLEDGAPSRESPPAIAAEINMSDRELHLATVPGERVFNPKQRRFEHEELRPLPVMRKAKKQFVPEEQKDDKYWERRRKNNVAAKRARDAQRIKMNQIMVRTAWLEKENEKLSAKLAESLEEQERLKERLSMYEDA